jgi:DNA-binding CsgD family transcriptional regulator
MSQPTADDLLLALDVVREVQAAPDLDAYRRAVLRVRELVPCQEIGYNEVDADTGEIFMILDPPESVIPGLHEAFARNVDDHPVISYHRDSGDGSARAISDFLSEEEFHQTGIYKEVYARMGAEDQLAFILPSPPSVIVGIAMNRPERSFGERDKEIIELVRPHLSQAFRDAQLRERIDPLSTTRLLGLGLTEREAEVMRLVVDGRSAGEIAEDLVISVHTARNHIAHAYEKLGVRNRAAAVAAVLRSAGPLESKPAGA